MLNENLIEIKGLEKHFKANEGVFASKAITVKAVDGVSFSIKRGETFGLVGESGCGKSTTGRCVLRLIEPTAGEVIFDGRDLLSLGGEDLRRLRGEMQIIFQDPYSSLDPRMRAGDIIEEPLVIHKRGDRSRRGEVVDNLLQKVGLKPEHRVRYPHEFSGGQRQRIGIARALALTPKFIVCDEPVSALDVSVQAQVVNLLQDLQAELGLTYLFISHGLNVVEHIANQVGIMYLGRLVEVAAVDEIFHNPSHPYTRALLSAVPSPDPERARIRVALKADLAPTSVNPDAGCRFNTRCPIAEPHCATREPDLVEIRPGHFAACFALHEGPPQ